MNVCAGDDTKENEKEVPCLKDPTTADTEIGAVDDDNDNVREAALVGFF